MIICSDFWHRDSLQTNLKSIWLRRPARVSASVSPASVSAPVQCSSESGQEGPWQQITGRRPGPGHGRPVLWSQPCSRGEAQGWPGPCSGPGPHWHARGPAKNEFLWAKMHHESQSRATGQWPGHCTGRLPLGLRQAIIEGCGWPGPGPASGALGHCKCKASQAPSHDAFFLEPSFFINVVLICHLAGHRAITQYQWMTTSEAQQLVGERLHRESGWKTQSNKDDWQRWLRRSCSGSTGRWQRCWTLNPCDSWFECEISE